jgi:PAS domain S-box-containing protein
MILLFFLIIISYYFYTIVKVRNVLKEESKRLKAEKTLKESEEKFRLLFEDHTAVKLILDPETAKIIDANKSASEFYGWSQEELKSMYLYDINTASAEEIKANMRKVLQKKKTHFEFRHKLKDQSIRDVEVFTSKITFRDKELLHSIIHDITERKRVEKELIEAKEHAEESDRLKTAFLQNLSHEIRTPMNAIMGFSSLLADNYNNREKLENYAEIINNRCNDLLSIINDILDISKIESGQLPVTTVECSLPQLFEELTEFFKENQKRIKKQHISFSLQAKCNPSDSVVMTDKVKLRQIFINLIGNAFKYTDSGRIEGGCKYEGSQLVFFVSDTGIGIPVDKQQLIFERFVQLHHDKNISYGGTGLGLSIVKGLVGILGGKIRVQSEPGKGTTFYFSFPIVRGTSVNAEDVTGVRLPEYHFQNKTILVVEDDPYNAAYIHEVLTETGLKIIHTELGREAVKIAKLQSPDLILLDIRLPDMNGLDVMRQMKQQNPVIKIIAQTAYAGMDDKQKAYDAGCNDYVSKPLNREVLLSMINKHLWRQ